MSGVGRQGRRGRRGNGWRAAGLTSVLAGALLTGAGACDSSDAEPGAAAGTTVIIGDGAYQLRFDTTSVTLDLLRGDERLVVIDGQGFQLGAVESPDDMHNYDPYPVAVAAPGARDADQWSAAESAMVEDSTATSFSIRLTHAGGEVSRLVATATATTSGEGNFALKFVPDAKLQNVVLLRVAPRANADEAYYGLGEYFDDVNNRGKIRAMQLELGGGLESSYNEAHVPIPFFTGSTGWGLFVESPYPAAFDMAATDEQRLTATFALGAASTDGLDFHLFAAEHPLDITRHYYDVTGYPAIPAPWALGPLVWRDENESQAQVLNDIQTMRDLDLAASGIWIDRPYATAVNTFDFKTEQFPDAKAMIARAHDLGFRVAIWHTPYLDDEQDATAELRNIAKLEQYYPTARGLLLNGWGPPIDLTNPAAFSWWQTLIGRYTDLGIEGYKLDYGEDVVPGAFGGRNVWEFFDGSDERTMHSRYQLFYHRAYAETLPEDGGFLLCRAATYGDQVNVNVIWPGDLDADFSRHGERVTKDDETYRAVGGLPASVIAGLSLGPSGFPFFGADSGGYRHSPPDNETFIRWFEQTALSTVMQIGTSSNDVAWEPTEQNGFDEQTLEIYRRYTRLHLRLWPYEWTYAQRIAVDGRPIQRALGLAYPELGVHPSDTYMFGDNLLVAPVVTRGQREREVMFPSGEWVNWWTGDVVSGGKATTVAAGLDTLPLFQARGSIVPLLRPSIDTMAPTTAPNEVDSYATTPGVLHARVALGETSTFALFDGTELSQEETDEGARLTSADGTDFKNGVQYEVIAFGTAVPKSVTVDGETLTPSTETQLAPGAVSGWAFDAAAVGGTLHVRTTSGAHTVVVTR